MSPFKTVIVNLLVKTPFANEEDLSVLFVKTLKYFLELSGESTVCDTSVQVKLLIEVCGDKIRGILERVISFSTRFSGDNLTFLNTLKITGRVFNLVLQKKNISECEKYSNTLILACGTETESLENLKSSILEIKEVYTRYLPDETFNIENV